MSKPSNIPPAPHQVSLNLHTAVLFTRREGITIVILQTAAATQFTTQLREEHAHGISRGQAVAENVRTNERAHMFALVLAMGLARSTLKRLYAAAARIKVQSVKVLCSLPAVVEAISHRRARGTTESLESVGSKEDRAMLRRVLESVRRLSRYGVQVEVVGCGAEGNTADAARVEMIARHRKKKVCRRRRHERRNRSTNTETAGDERGDGGGEEGERGGADDRGEGRSDGSHWGRSTERESSSAFAVDETGEPEWHKLEHILLIFVLQLPDV
jgi:hypothetical protein